MVAQVQQVETNGASRDRLIAPAGRTPSARRFMKGSSLAMVIQLYSPARQRMKPLMQKTSAGSSCRAHHFCEPGLRSQIDQYPR